MRFVISSILGIIMGIGGYALVQATLKEREAKSAQAAELERCERTRAMMLSEFDEIVGRAKFPNQDQQDYWRQMMEGCEP